MLTQRRFVARYLATGILNVSVNYGVFMLLYAYAHLWYVVASVLSFVARCAVKFTLLRYWTFGHAARTHPLLQLAAFAASEGTSYLMGLALLTGLVEGMHLAPPTALLIVIAALYAFGFAVSVAIFQPRRREP